MRRYWALLARHYKVLMQEFSLSGFSYHLCKKRYARHLHIYSQDVIVLNYNGNFFNYLGFLDITADRVLICLFEISIIIKKYQISLVCHTA